MNPKKEIEFISFSKEHPRYGTKIIAIIETYNVVPRLVIGEFWEDDFGTDNLIPYIITEDGKECCFPYNYLMVWCKLEDWITIANIES
jgi:hypothetical protein